MDEQFTVPPPNCRWAAIPGFPDYRVYEDGSVWSRKIHSQSRKIGPWRPMKARSTRAPTVIMHDGEQWERKQIAHMVLELVGGQPRPSVDHCVIPVDGDVRNCRLDNLRWGTRPEVQQAVAASRRGKKNANPDLSLLEPLGQQIRELRRAKGWSSEELERRAGIGASQVLRVENARGSCSLMTVSRIAAALGCDIRLVPKE